MSKTIQNNLQKTHKTIYRITATAILISLAVVMKLLVSITIPFLGAGGMTMTMAGVVTAFPAILFGPVYGGVASALCDLIGHLVKPTGAYIPWLTVTAFVGGFLKGVLWLLLLGKAKLNNILCLLSAVFILILGTGVLAYGSLAGDGVADSLITTKESVPYRGEIDAMSLSPFSKLITDCAQYNKDTFTLQAAGDAEVIVLPYGINVAGKTDTITKIADSALADCTELKECYIPSGYKTIGKNIFGDRNNVVIYGEAGSAAEDYAVENNLTFRAAELPEKIIVTSDENEGFTVKNSDTYRKYLSGYINFATFGMILTGFLGLGIMLIAWLTRKAKEHDAGSNFALIAVTLTASGAVTTTINTWILREFLTAWNGRSFLLLWIPRIIEELIVCIIQAYIVAVLYDIYKKRIESKIRST